MATPAIEAGDLDTSGGQRTPYTRVAVLGLVVAGTAPLWVLVPEGLEAVPFIAPLVVVPLVAAAALWRRRRWARVLGVVSGVAVLGVGATGAADAAGHPDSFFDFYPLVSMLVGGALGAGGSAVSWWRLRTGGRGGARGERSVLAGAGSMLVALAVVSAVLTATGKHTVSAVDRFDADPVVFTDFEFEPAAFAVPAGRRARFVVRNDDLALHTFTIDELGIDAVVKPGDEVLVEFTPEEPGTYLLYCRPHTYTETEGMVATFAVE